MRPVDADALIAKQASIAKTFARSDAQKSLMGRVMYNTEKAPTVDAIPVEWMEQKRRSLMYDAISGFSGTNIEEIHAINVVLTMWKGEMA